jgi:hypothetical protein
MANKDFDRETLRELADEGNETALDRLADLADADGDLGEPSELLDEGSIHAGFLLTRCAVAAGDLRELQRISDTGYDEAGHELERLLKGPTDGPGLRNSPCGPEPPCRSVEKHPVMGRSLAPATGRVR